MPVMSFNLTFAK